MVGTADSVLIREVFFIQSVLYIEVPLYTANWSIRGHCELNMPQISCAVKLLAAILKQLHWHRLDSHERNWAVKGKRKGCGAGANCLQSWPEMWTTHCQSTWV